VTKGKRIIIILAVIIVLIGLVYGSIKYTSTAKFCGSCKTTMGPVYKTWAASTHSSEKNPEIKHHHECMACHSDPGLIGYIRAKSAGMLSVYYQLSGDYHLPLKATKSVDCSRSGCHPKTSEIKEEKVIVKHPEHTELMAEIINEKFQCMPCHRGVAHGGPDDPLHRSTRPDHTVCSLCHKEIKKCEQCHRNYQKLDLSAHCSRPECHAHLETIKEKKIKVNHPKHVKVMNSECKPCHLGHRKQGYARPGHKVCSSCHDVSGDCTFCHKAF